MTFTRVIKWSLLVSALLSVPPAYPESDDSDAIVDFGVGTFLGFVSPFSSVFIPPGTTMEHLGRMAGSAMRAAAVAELHTHSHDDDSRRHLSSRSENNNCYERKKGRRAELEKVLPDNWQNGKPFPSAVAPFAMALGSSKELSRSVGSLSASLWQKIPENQNGEGIRFLFNAISDSLYKPLQNMVYEYEATSCLLTCGPVGVDVYALLQDGFSSQGEVDYRAGEIYQLVRKSYGWGSRAHYDTNATANFFNRQLGIEHANYVTLRNQFLDNEAHRSENQKDLYQLIRFIVYVLTANQFQWLENQRAQSGSFEQFESRVIQYTANVTINAYKLLAEWLSNPYQVHICYYYRCYGFWSYPFWLMNRMDAVEVKEHSAPEVLQGHPYPLSQDLFDWYILVWTNRDQADSLFNLFKSYYLYQICAEYEET